jgi:hypothetical protein
VESAEAFARLAKRGELFAEREADEMRAELRS